MLFTETPRARFKKASGKGGVYRIDYKHKSIIYFTEKCSMEACKRGLKKLIRNNIHEIIALNNLTSFMKYMASPESELGSCPNIDTGLLPGKEISRQSITKHPIIQAP